MKRQGLYRAAHIANFILDRAERDGVRDIDILKLLKLVYIFFGWASVVHKKFDLFSDSIDAWDYGPVVPSLYYELRRYGKKHVEGRACLYDPFGDEAPEIPMEEDIADADVLDTLNILWDVYKDAPAGHLIALTHKKGSPWWESYDGRRNREIPKELIRKYFADLYRKAVRKQMVIPGLARPGAGKAAVISGKGTACLSGGEERRFLEDCTGWARRAVSVLLSFTAAALVLYGYFSAHGKQIYSDSVVITLLAVTAFSVVALSAVMIKGFSASDP